MCPSKNCFSTNFKICSDTLKCKKCGLTQKGHEAAVKGWRTRKALAKRTESRRKSFNAVGAVLLLWAIVTAVSLPFQSSTVLYQKAYAQDVPDHIAREDKMVQELITAPDKKPETLSEKIDRHADENNIPRKSLHALVKCESGYNPTARNHSSVEDSRGLVQINMLAGHGVKVSEANDPDFALSWAGSHWEQRHALWLNCSRLHKL